MRFSTAPKPDDMRFQSPEAVMLERLHEQEVYTRMLEAHAEETAQHQAAHVQSLTAEIDALRLHIVSRDVLLVNARATITRLRRQYTDAIAKMCRVAIDGDIDTAGRTGRYRIGASIELDGLFGKQLQAAELHDVILARFVDAVRAELEKGFPTTPTPTAPPP